MTEPPADPTAVLLARIEVKLDNSLREQARDRGVIDRHEATLGEHGNRLTKLEAVDERDERNTQRTYSGKQLAATAAGSIGVAVSAIVPAILALKGHG